MTAPLTAQRPGLVSIVMIVTSIGLSVGLSLALDWFVFSNPAASMDVPLLSLPLNATAILQSVVGAIIEWRRPGTRIVVAAGTSHQRRATAGQAREIGR